MRTTGFLKTSEGRKYLLCDGSQVPAEYSKLRSLMTHVPDLRDRVPQGAGTKVLGTTIEAGLPNITGTFSASISGDDGVNGVFYWSDPYYWWTNAGAGKSRTRWFYFNAARCSAIYGKSSTVQPPAVAVNFYIKAK